MLNEELELAWAAGFFDGEGCGHLTSSGYPALDIGQIDPEVLVRFQRAVGGGKIYGPYQPNNKRAQLKWEYNVMSHDAVAIMERLLPYLSAVKTTQWNAVLNDPKRRKQARPGYCRKDLHLLEGNQNKEWRCIPCRTQANRNRDAGRRKAPQDRLNTKLTSELVLEIRKADLRQTPRASLAAIYGVSVSNIDAVRSKKTWKDL